MTDRAHEGDLATQLHDWATTEMHFHPQGPYLAAAMPTAADLKRICRGSHQADLWKYVLKNVHSVQTVKKVKGNLQLKGRSQRQGYKVKYKSDSRYDDERQSLLAQRAQLVGEMSRVLSETRQLEEELGRMESDIHRAESEYQNEVEELRNLERKTCLLRVHCRTAHHFNADLDTLADKVKARVQAVVKGKTGVDTAFHTRDDDDDADDRGNGQLETSTSRDVRVSCEQISQFLHQTLQGSFSRDRSAFHLNKDQVWKQVETTLSDHDIGQVVASLVQHSQQGALVLRDHTAKVSIKKDAEKLRFKYEKGGVTDMATQPSLLHSLTQLLEESQQQHVMRFVETEKHRNAAQPLLHRLQKTRSKMDAIIQRQFAQQPGTIQMASMLIQTQLAVVGDRTARDSYRQEAETLRERLCQEQNHRDALLTLHRTIQDFQDLANAKQSLIQVVAKQNAGARSRLTAQQQGVSHYITKVMPSHPLTTVSLTSELKGAVSKEVGKAASLCLPYLVYLHLDSETRLGLLDLSIHHTNHPTAISVRQPLQGVLRHLHFPFYKAPESVLRQCVQLKEEEEHSREAVARLEHVHLRLVMGSGVETDLDNVTELCDKVRRQDHRELQQLLPTLQKGISKAARASTQCIKVKDSVTAWWDQPAQFTTPWLTTGELTFQEWFNKWRVIVTKIRQLDLHH